MILERLNIIAVDPDRKDLSHLETALKSAVPGCHVSCFFSGKRALAHARARQVDIAFLETNIPEKPGLQLAAELRVLHAGINIIFITGDDSHLREAFLLRASGYLVKPATRQEICCELENLRNPPERTDVPKVRMQCFGNFEVFVDGGILPFRRSKCKELLAFLVHQNGGSVSSASIAAVLWEDKEYNRSLRSQTQTVISLMMKILRQAGIEDIICKSWNCLALDTGKVQCDYYDFLNGDPIAKGAYRGEYMNTYSWAEYTAGHLNERAAPQHR